MLNFKAKSAHFKVLTAMLLRTYYSGIRHCVVGRVVPDVSGGLYCLHFQVPSSSKTATKDNLILEEEGTKVLRNVGDFSPKYTASLAEDLNQQSKVLITFNQ
jgi:hypothetical protein